MTEAVIKLTKNQEAFAQGVASGLNQTEAYRSAYNTSRMKDSTVWSRASELAAHRKVAARIAQLKAELASKQLWTREMSVKALMQAYKVAQDNKQASAMTLAVKELNAMHGHNEPIPIDVSNRDGSLSYAGARVMDEIARAMGRADD